MRMGMMAVGIGWWGVAMLALILAMTGPATVMGSAVTFGVVMVAPIAAGWSLWRAGEVA